MRMSFQHVYLPIKTEVYAALKNDPDEATHQN